jgi:hypothetical protein
MTGNHMVGKKPQLQYEILLVLAQNGAMSKSKIVKVLQNHYYPDVSIAVEKLKENRYTEISHTKIGRGRPEVYYRITHNGVGILVQDEPSPHKFWIAIIGYCYHKNELLTLSDLEELFSTFANSYLTYSATNYFYSFLDDLASLYEGWIDYLENKQNGDNSASQKLFEVLSISPSLSKEGLSKKIGLSSSDIDKFLRRFIPIKHMLATPKEGTLQFLDTETDEIYEKRDWRFLLHYTVMAKKVHGKERYELSLFGILMVLGLLRRSQLNSVSMTYNSELSFQDYFDRIAENYASKLPSIFGKWHLFRKVLKDLAAYNFDIILNRSYRKSVAEKSIMIGGTAEFMRNKSTMISYARIQIGQIQSLGSHLSDNFLDEFPIIDRRQCAIKIQAISQLLYKIFVLMFPFYYDPMSFSEGINLTLFDDKQKASEIGKSFDLEIIEQSLAEEVTLFFIINLLREDLEISFELNKLSKVSSGNIKTKGYDSVDPKSIGFGKILLSIMKSDEDLSNWWSLQLNDFVKFELSTLRKMKILNNID